MVRRQQVGSWKEVAASSEPCSVRAWRQSEEGEREASWPPTWPRREWGNSGARTQVCEKDWVTRDLLIFQVLRPAANGRMPGP